MFRSVYMFEELISVKQPVTNSLEENSLIKVNDFR